MLNLTSTSPALATLLFVIAVIAGHLYRKHWKNEGPAWKLWLYGMLSGALLLLVAFV